MTPLDEWMSATLRPVGLRRRREDTSETRRLVAVVRPIMQPFNGGISIKNRPPFVLFRGAFA